MRRARAVPIALLVLGAAGARAETPFLAIDPAQTQVQMTLEVIFSGSDSETEPVAFAGTATADIVTEEHASFGRVARTLQFRESEIVAADTSFDLVLPLFALDVEVQSLAGSFTDEVLDAVPVAPRTSSVALAPMDLRMDSGTIAMTVTPPGTLVEFDVAEAPFVFALGETGAIVAAPQPGSTDFSVTIPVDETASSTTQGITVNVTLVGDLVLVGSAAVPATSAPGAALLALLLALAGGVAVRNCPRKEAAMLEVRYDPKVCIHSGNCVKGLPRVFRVENKKFVIDPTQASEAEVRAQVAKCPSGALTIQER